MLFRLYFGNFHLPCLIKLSLIIDLSPMKQLLLLVLPFLASAWWDVGHMLTAAIAESRLNQLDPYSSAHFRSLVTSINDLCDNRSRSFIESACWPDDIKGSAYGMNLFDAFHYKDGPYVADTVVPVINYTEGTVNSLAVMAEASRVLADSLDKDTAQRALFARYVVHLVGDMHQPLHSVALFNATYPKGDIGGNAEKVTLVNGSTSNFHSYWDAGGYVLQNDSWFIVRPMNLQNLTVLKQVANGMIQQYGKAVEELGRIIDPLVWAQESFNYAVNTTYPHIFGTNKINEAYNTLTYETARKRITLAGYRLANYIIDLYKAAPGRQRTLEIESLKEVGLPLNQRSPKQLWNFLAQDSKRSNLFKLLKGVNIRSE